MYVRFKDENASQLTSLFTTCKSIKYISTGKTGTHCTAWLAEALCTEETALSGTPPHDPIDHRHFDSLSHDIVRRAAGASGLSRQVSRGVPTGRGSFRGTLLWLRSRAYMFADEFGHLRWHFHLSSYMRVVNLKDRFGENVRRLTCVGTARAMGQPVRRNVDLVSSSHRQYAWLGVRRLVGTISQHLRTSAPT